MLTCTTMSLNVIRHTELSMLYGKIRTNSSKTLTLLLCINHGIMVPVNYTPSGISSPRNNRNFGSGCTRSMEGFHCDFFSWKNILSTFTSYINITYIVFKKLFISHSTSSYINNSGYSDMFNVSYKDVLTFINFI